ncbi:glycosyltransferase [bacterium]|nr:glycosyltransferase [bacterium]
MDRAKALSWAAWTAQGSQLQPADERSGVTTADFPLDLAIVILNYNTHDLLRNCLDSVFAAQGNFLYAVCVVDNASSDDSVDMVRRHFPLAGVIAQDQNRGFSAGNNVAMRTAGFAQQTKNATTVLPRYVLLLNPDTLVPPTALAQMIAFMDANPSIGVAGPRVRRLDGTLDRACRRSFPTPRVSFFRMTGLSRLFPHSRTFNAYNLEYLPEDAVHAVDSVVGAYMQVRREAVEAVGLLDENYFMYGEDLDWAKRIKDAGWEIWYNGQVEITHVKEAASRRSRKARLAFYEAMWIFYRKHYQAETPWWLDKLILLGIGIKGGADIALRMWQLRGDNRFHTQR